jgi:uncharacterized membrane protein
VVALGALYATAIPYAFVDDDRAYAAFGLVAYGVFLVYCFARPRGGVSLFFIAAAPGATGTLLNDAFDLPRWIGLVLVPVSLWLAREEDREPERSA